MITLVLIERYRGKLSLSEGTIDFEILPLLGTVVILLFEIFSKYLQSLMC
jgi:hypothetical protein